ncbi:exosortase N [Dyadobacter luticola]|uniref:Exosortase N n=1 Tax=Dyadobacter luticola TaxID=1979387 RepID=A0A5R9KRJ8_9BACT|nr:exosortase N [Dyadobacter luticola]TLU98911.1 exosortase N [Dyadobacter luticola]
MHADKFAAWFLLAGYVVLLGSLLSMGYLQGDATCWIGLGLLPLVILSSPTSNKNWWLGFFVAVFLIICLFRKEQTFRYLLLVSSLLFVIQHVLGRLNLLVAAVLIIISPLFRYLSEVFTFPIRLQLSEWSAFILKLANVPVTVSGNIMQLGGADFSVDPACMGLQMTGFSLLAGIFLIIQEQQKTRKEIGTKLKILVLATAFTFNIAGNLIRIITLVIFHIAPENPFHDWIGIACLLLYVWLPVSLIVEYLTLNFGKITPSKNNITWKPDFPAVALHITLLLACSFFIFQKQTFKPASVNVITSKISGDYQMNVLASGVTQFKNAETLIYVKPIPEFFTTEHNPAICWVGSGYELTAVKEQVFSGKKIYVGTLKKGSDKLQTAWWFSNSKHTTISQLDWRWRAMTGEGDFQLVNVTAGSEKNLNDAINRWLQQI